MPPAHLLPASLSRLPRCAHPLKPISLCVRVAVLGMALAAATFHVASLAAGPQPLDAVAVQPYSIPAGPLGRTLASFAVNAGIALSFDPALTDGLTSPALAGRYPVRDAITRLLVGSGLEIVARADGSYTLRKLAASAPKRESTTVEVTLPVVRVTANATAEGTAASAYRAKSASVGTLGDKALKDTPYSIEVVPRELMDNKQVRTLSEALKGDASVGLSGDTSVYENNALTIRGFNTFGSPSRLDGLTLRNRAADLPLEHIESVELLKGAAGFLYGFGEPGGIVNYKLKRSTEQPLRSISTQVTDSGQWLLHGDFGGRAGTDGIFGYRVNLVGESGDTYIGEPAGRGSASVALDWRITPDVVWQVDALKAKNVRHGGYWAVIPNADGVADNWDAAQPLAPINGSKRLAPSWSRYESQQDTFGTDLNWHFAPDWDLALAHRTSKSGRGFFYPALFTDAAGNYSGIAYNYATVFKSAQTQARVSGKFDTGPVAHEVTVGVGKTTTRSMGTPDSFPDQESVTFGPGNLANPGEFVGPLNRYGIDTATQEFSRVTRREIFASDTLHLGSNWDLVVGALHGTLDDAYGDYKRSATTPTLAVVYRPVAGLSLYGSYIEALEEGATAPQTAANAGEIFPPLVSKQHEVGAKFDGDKWSASAALFQLQQGLTYTTPSNVFTQDGEARYRGLELNAKARFGTQWLVTASAILLDATNQKTDSGFLDGKHMEGVARKQISLYSEYRIPGVPLTLTAGMQYQGKRPVDSQNRWYHSAVTLLDAGARYETQWDGRLLTLRLNVDNLADKAYWVGGSSLVQGAPRTVKLGAQLDF